MNWTVYLSGEIHSDWRQQIIDGSAIHNLPITFTSAVTDHEASDAAGDVLGSEQNAFWRDHKSSKVNAIRTRTQLENCDSQLFDLEPSTNNGMRLLMPDFAQQKVRLTSRSMMRILSMRLKKSMPPLWHGLKRLIKSFTY